MDLIPLSVKAAGAQVNAMLRSMEHLPPTSRVAVRDGYYGLGNVDFDLAEKISSSTLLNAGGRVCTYNGRFPNNAGYGLNLRAEVGYTLSPNLSGWAGLMQNRLNSEVPFTSLRHNRERYDADVVLNWRGVSGDLYGFQQNETYGGTDADHWQELGVIVGTVRNWGMLQADFQAQAAQARWRLKGRDWTTTTFGALHSDFGMPLFQDLKLTAHLGIHLSDDFNPAQRLGLILEKPILPGIQLFVGSTQHQEFPSRFETSAFYAPQSHYLPFDSTFYIYPSQFIVGNTALKNETYSAVFAGTEARTERLSGSLAAFWHHVEDPISWQMQNDTVRAFNADFRENRGLLGWAVLRPGWRLEFGATGSWLALKDYEKRLFPEVIAHGWAQYRQPLFQNHLELRWRTWVDFWSKRSAPIPFGWEVLPNDVILSSRISAYLLGVQLFWEVRNITNLYYQLAPGLDMMHKEEVWGVAWNFKN